MFHSYNGSIDDERYPGRQVKDYTSHSKRLHRRHRGIMQWKGARTLDWMMTKAQHGKGKATGFFQRGNRDPGWRPRRNPITEIRFLFHDRSAKPGRTGSR